MIRGQVKNCPPKKANELNLNKIWSTCCPVQDGQVLATKFYTLIQCALPLAEICKGPTTFNL